MRLKLQCSTLFTLLIMIMMGSVLVISPVNAQDLPTDPDEMFDIELIDDSLDVMLDDSLDILMSDTTLFEEEFFEDIEEEFPWTLNTGISLRNRQVQNGVDLSGSQGLLSIGTELSHEGGFLFGFDAARRVGDSPGPQGWNARLGYQYSASEWLDLSAQFTRFG
ncbi:MAG: hypothetical protein ACK5ET_00175, partial [Ignavibacteria bacterium]